MMASSSNKQSMRKRSSYSGATRSGSAPKDGVGRYFRGLLRGSLFLLSGAILAVVGFLTTQFIERASERPINGVNIAGDFHFINEDRIAQLVAPKVKDGFLLVPLDEIKSTLEAIPWVEHAAVARRWPDQLSITVVEQSPIARWGNRGFLNRKGEVVVTAELQQLEHLPVLSGSAEQAKLLMQNYQQLSQILRPSGLVIRELYCDPLLSWRVVLGRELSDISDVQPGISVALGRDQIMDKIQRFLVVYGKSLSKKIDDIAAIDLRYGNGVAVHWKQQVDNNSEGSQIQLATLGERTR